MIRLIQVVLVVLPTLAAFQAVMATPGLHEMLVVLETILLVHLVKLANQATGDKRSDPESSTATHGLLHCHLFPWFHPLLLYYLLYTLSHLPSCLFNFGSYLS